jgi:hypothetical protein
MAHPNNGISNGTSQKTALRVTRVLRYHQDRETQSPSLAAVRSGTNHVCEQATETKRSEEKRKVEGEERKVKVKAKEAKKQRSKEAKSSSH